jgi:transposase-like protein
MQNTEMKISAVTEVKPYTLKELSHIYGISEKTMRRWLKPLKDQTGPKRSQYFTVRQVEIIFKNLGIPHQVHHL